MRYDMHLDSFKIVLNSCINLILVYCYNFCNLHVTLNMPEIDTSMLHDIARPWIK